MLNEDRSGYEFLKQELDVFSIVIRYSIDAYDTFFPMLNDWNEAKVNYSKTIGSYLWVMSVRASLERLIGDLNPRFIGLVSGDIVRIFENEGSVKAVLNGYRR